MLESGGIWKCHEYDAYELSIQSEASASFEIAPSPEWDIKASHLEEKIKGEKKEGKERSFVGINIK